MSMHFLTVDKSSNGSASAQLLLGDTVVTGKSWYVTSSPVAATKTKNLVQVVP